MTIRPRVQQLVNLGPLPASSEAEEDDLRHRAEMFDGIQKPVSDEEALALLCCSGSDACHGFAWSLVHLIETAPGGASLQSEPDASENEWIRFL